MNCLAEKSVNHSAAQLIWQWDMNPAFFFLSFSFPQKGTSWEASSMVYSHSDSNYCAKDLIWYSLVHVCLLFSLKTKNNWRMNTLRRLKNKITVQVTGPWVIEKKLSKSLRFWLVWLVVWFFLINYISVFRNQWLKHFT